MTHEASPSIRTFFSVIEIRTTQTGHEVDVALNPDHEVYAGHFPENPVAPGVLLTDMARRVACQVLGQERRLVSARQVKFLSVVDPCITQRLTLHLKLTPTEHGQQLVCSATNGETTYFKIIGELG